MATAIAATAMTGPRTIDVEVLLCRRRRGEMRYPPGEISQ
jgi:hypothetical protein